MNVFDITNPEHRQYLMDNADSIRRQAGRTDGPDAWSTFIPLNTIPDDKSIRYNLYKDKIVLKRDGTDRFFIYYDDNTTAEYSAELKSISKFDGLRYQENKDIPSDGIFIMFEDLFIVEKNPLPKDYYYNDHYNDPFGDYLPWDYFPFLYFFINSQTKSLNTFTRELGNMNIQIPDNAVRGRVAINYLTIEGNYKATISASADIKNRQDEIFRQFNVDKEKNEIRFETFGQ